MARKLARVHPNAEDHVVIAAAAMLHGANKKPYPAARRSMFIQLGTAVALVSLAVSIQQRHVELKFLVLGAVSAIAVLGPAAPGWIGRYDRQTA